MIRPILTELALFLAPFVLYAAFLWATRKGIFVPAAWSWRTIASLTIIALLSVIVSFVLLAQFTGAPPHSTYVPAHIENGKFVPGHNE
ncbi:MAG: DUF6111 family protein [Variibacter sp.]